MDWKEKTLYIVIGIVLVLPYVFYFNVDKRTKDIENYLNASAMRAQEQMIAAQQNPKGKK